MRHFLIYCIKLDGTERERVRRGEGEGERKWLLEIAAAINNRKLTNWPCHRYKFPTRQFRQAPKQPKEPKCDN